MNTAKWDAIAESFAEGMLVPANGHTAWEGQAAVEAGTIRNILPESVETLLEVGCGVGRLTPYLAILFPNVVSIDTSAACRIVTRKRCVARGQRVTVLPTGVAIAGIDAAVVWGNLYDDDWSDEAAREHTAQLCAGYPLVLIQHPRGWTLADSGDFTTGGEHAADEWVLLRTARHALL